jgi:hypothetical protein
MVNTALISVDKLDINEIRNLYWKDGYNIEDVSKKLGVSFWKLYNFMEKHNIGRRNRSEASYLVNRYKPQFKINSDLTIAGEKLKVAGIMLYWAEGTLKGNTVDFTNSDPRMVRIFLKFLREVCGVDERRLRVYLYVYSKDNLEEIKKYWNGLTAIPLSQFTKPYIRETGVNQGNRKLPYGLVHIRYNDKKLLELIKIWISEWINNIDWAGTQVAKGGRLCKRSVMPKGMMEK